MRGSASGECGPACGAAEAARRWAISACAADSRPQASSAWRLATNVSPRTPADDGRDSATPTSTTGSQGAAPRKYSKMLVNMPLTDTMREKWFRDSAANLPRTET
jgi:hypothetical protein